MAWLTRLAEESNLEKAVNDCYRILSLVLATGCMVARHDCGERSERWQLR